MAASKDKAIEEKDREIKQMKTENDELSKEGALKIYPHETDSKDKLIKEQKTQIQQLVKELSEKKQEVTRLGGDKKCKC